ncbi:MAG: 3'(2'),5'-bisphosphate nucleotidase CysQ [Candidatus Altiarchaeales archaeon ex4484_96]|nr:MAG: 3'(2'),5'-bisphosphate nucleotidase CysQ [Candidatus Altiarchaeales archaeon ex4484_96]
MDYPSILRDVLGLVKQAGKGVLEVYGDDFEVEHKSDNSPVTQADWVSEETLLEGLSDYGYGFFSEESGFSRSGKSGCWLIDPLDGTRDFVERTGDYSVMVGLLVDGVPVLGVVHAPVSGKTWYAVRGGGAFLDDRRIHVSDVSDLGSFRMLVSRFHRRRVDERVSSILGISSFTRSGSVGIKFGLIAQGEAELCFYTTDRLCLWDCAAPQVILEEAGGLVFDVGGNRLVYDFSSGRMINGFVGCNGRNKQKMVEAISKVI